MESSTNGAPSLLRVLRLHRATAMVVGTIIGASIFVQPSEITGRVPSLPGAALVWLVAGELPGTGPGGDRPVRLPRLETSFEGPFSKGDKPLTIVDFHNHYFPPDYVEAIRRGPSNFRVTVDGDGNPVLHSPGDYNILVPGHRDLDFRTRVLDGAGVDVQVLTLTAPATSIETPQRAAELAALVNDRLAAAAEERRDRFTALGHLPMNAPEAAVDELERGVGELGLRGFMLFSNASGVALADARFEPLWQRADAHGCVIYIHPTYPVGVEAMEDYMLMPLVGFTLDTTLAAAHLVFAGVPERHPRIRWVLGHLGGTIPYLAERLDRGYEAFERCRVNIPRPPTEYLRDFYYDTVNFDPKALRLAVDFAGVDRILAGSDYPHMIGSLEKMVSSLRALGLGAEDEAKVLGGNAHRLLGL